MPHEELGASASGFTFPRQTFVSLLVFAAVWQVLSYLAPYLGIPPFAIPSLVLRFISIDPFYWGTGWHYNATVMPILFIAAAEAIGRWQRVPALTVSCRRRTGGQTRSRRRDRAHDRSRHG